MIFLYNLKVHFYIFCHAPCNKLTCFSSCLDCKLWGLDFMTRRMWVIPFKMHLSYSWYVKQMTEANLSCYTLTLFVLIFISSLCSILASVLGAWWKHLHSVTPTLTSKEAVSINFPIWWSSNIFNLFNISMMLFKCIIWWFRIEVTN